MKTMALRRIAIHEAGHAVVAWQLGVRLRKVTVKPDGDYLGKMWHRQTHNADDWDAAGGSEDRAQVRLGRKVKIAFAGPLAEKRAFPRTRWRRHASSDINDAADIIAHVYFNERAQYLWSSLLWLETELLLGEGWLAVVALADQLITRQTLTGRDARDVILEAFALDRGEEAVA